MALTKKQVDVATLMAIDRQLQSIEPSGAGRVALSTTLLSMMITDLVEDLPAERQVEAAGQIVDRVAQTLREATIEAITKELNDGHQADDGAALGRPQPDRPDPD